MFDKYSKMNSSDGNVWKYIFESDNAIAEAVLYRYGSFGERTVICCSVMSGCPVGCTFCGTGKKFIQNLTSPEIVQQVETILHDMNIEDINTRGKRFQIMFMSMGEPMLNWHEVEVAIRYMYYGKKWTNAEYLISTIGVNKDDVFARIIDLSKEIDKVGLQFSIHQSSDADRDFLIPYRNKWGLCKIRDAGITWRNQVGRKPFLNYCIDGTNNKHSDFIKLSSLFSPVIFNFTFSVVCSPDETMKEAGYKNLEAINRFSEYFLEHGYNTRVFNPAGQDDIGGGCGQLWYVQEWLKRQKS